MADVHNRPASDSNEPAKTDQRDLPGNDAHSLNRPLVIDPKTKQLLADIISVSRLPGNSPRNTPYNPEDILFFRLESAIKFGRWSGFENLLSNLQNMGDALPEGELVKLLNRRETRAPFSQTVLHKAYLNKAPLSVIQLLINLGADPALRFHCRDQHNQTVFRWHSIIHIIVQVRDHETLKIIPNLKETLSLRNGRGQMPIHSYIAFHHDAGIKTKWIKKVLALMNDHNPLTSRNENMADLLISRLQLEDLQKYKRAKLPAPRLFSEEQLKLSIPWAAEFFSHKSLLKFMTEASSILPDEVNQEFRTIFNSGKDIKNALLYLLTYSEATNYSEVRGESLVRLMPELLWRYPYDQIKELLNAVEDYNDDLIYTKKITRQGKPLRPHPNEAELLLLMNHPELPSLAPRYINFITTAVTSRERFIDRDPAVRINYSVAIQNMAKIGALTHGFLPLKHDTRSFISSTGDRIPSLLEQYGARSIELPTDVPHHSRRSYFGKSFIISGRAKDGLEGKLYDRENNLVTIKLDPEILVVARRGYYLVSHPEHGTQLIRNSSLVFGRDQLKQPAYYSQFGIGQGIDLKELLMMDESLLNDVFHPFLIPELFDNGSDHLQDNVEFLIQQLQLVLNDYHLWKCNTDPESSFVEADGKLRWQGPWQREGFSALLQYLDQIHAARKIELSNHGKNSLKVPHLAWSHRELPWGYYDFVDQYGQRQTKLEIDDERMETLIDFSKRQARKHAMIDSGLQSFFQTGINKRAFLIMLD